MKTHAYLIMAHNEPNALKILLSVLDDTRNKIYIHIDQKSTSLNKKEIAQWCKKASILFVSQEKVYWSGYSQISIIINLLRAGIRDNNAYYHLLSGVDLPLKSQNELHAFFNKNPTKEYISTGRIRSWKIASRYKYYYFEKWITFFSRNTYRIIRLLWGTLQAMVFIDRTRGLPIEYHMGGNWFSITHDFACYVVEHEPLIKKLFNYGFCVDEIFMPTLVMNSPFKDRVSSMMNLRYVDWNRGKPYTWQKGDFEELTTKNIFFARKFSYENHPGIMEKIKNYHFN